jgi:hypothetical protein
MLRFKNLLQLGFGLLFAAFMHPTQLNFKNRATLVILALLQIRPTSPTQPGHVLVQPVHIFRVRRLIDLHSLDPRWNEVQPLKVDFTWIRSPTLMGLLSEPGLFNGGKE